MKTRILVVDDESEGRYMLRALLEGHGFEVLQARNGSEALEVARRQLPDAVITDLMMPVMDGFSLCREWMDDPSLQLKPVIVYSATYTDRKDRQLAMDMGATVFLTKPLDPEALVEAIGRALERSSQATSPPQPLDRHEALRRHAERLQAKLACKIDQLASAQQAMVDYVTRTESILDAAADAIVSIDPGHLISSWNLSAEALLGYAESEAVGRPFESIVPEEARTQARLDLEAAAGAVGVRCRERQWLHKDGRRVDVSVTISPLGPGIGLVAVASDLAATRRAALERRRLEDQLAVSQRLESVGRLAGGVAHDFNNLLTVILFHAGEIESELGPAHLLHEDATQIREAGERAVALTRQLLAFSRRQTIKPEILDLNEAIRSIEKMLRRLIGEDIDLRMGLAPNLAPVEADVSQLEQVILNLAVNARDAMPDGGRLVVETRNVEIDEAEAARLAPMPAGPFVLLTIADSGVGMDAETQKHAFEPFFTTKDFGKGSGLGLSTVYGIVKQSNGYVWLDSEPGAGTTVRVFLPRAERPLAVGKPGSVASATRGARGETILVVEDDDLVRALARKMLERAGYRVLEAASGGDALLLAEKSDAKIDLLLTDVVMPSTNGRDLARSLLARRPATKVVFISGYTDDVVARHGVLEPGVSLVAKPFSAETLTEVVRSVLDGALPGGLGDR